MSQPTETIPLHQLKDWLTTQARRERLNGEIDHAAHTISLRNQITKAVKKYQQNQPQQQAQYAQHAMKEIA